MSDPKDDPTRTGWGNSGTRRPAGPLPEKIGSYRVKGVIGEGGMGVVFLAEQLSPLRDVAVKVLRAGSFATDHDIRLMQREAESLARLKHPGIAAIYEAGTTEEGRPFFAMELVSGDTLGVRFAAGARPLTRDEVERRLRLVIKVCRAVSYAHQRGIVHRDLKPTNVIVVEDAAGARQAGVPEVKILDFGLAHMSDADVEATTTAAGMIVGTLAYMSPEQGRGDPAEIDARTDVYALGVILYEALADTRPIEPDPKSLGESLRRLADDPPRRLRATWRGARPLDPDLETIVHKALEKDPEQRYGSAAALADDLERYLGSEPILARPPTAWYLARKFAARNRVFVAGVAATALAIVAGAVVSTVFGMREAQQRRLAERTSADLAAVVDFQARMLRDVDPEATGTGIAATTRAMLADALTRRGRDQDDVARSLAALDAALSDVGPTDVARRVLKDSVLAPAAATAQQEFAGRPELEARLLETIAETYGALGMSADAEPLVRRALERRAGSGSPALRTELLLGRMILDRGGSYEATSMIRSVRDRAQSLLGIDHPLTVEASMNLGKAFWHVGRYDEAERLLAEVLPRVRAAFGDDPRSKIGAMNALAASRMRLGRPEGADPLYTEALEICRKELRPHHPLTLAALNNLANARAAGRRLDEADALLREALAGFREVLGETHPTALIATGNLARLAAHRGRFDEAEGLHREVLALSERARGAGHRDTLSAMNALAVFLTGRGRVDEAISLLDELLRRSRGTLDEDSTERAVYVHSHAEALLAAGDLPGAESKLAAALAVYEERGSQFRGLARWQLAIVSARRGARAETLTRLRAAADAGRPRAGLLADPSFQRWRDDPEFAALLLPAAAPEAR